MILQNVAAHLPQLIAFHMQKISATGTLQMKMMLASHADGVLIDETVRTRRLKTADHAILQQGGNLPVYCALARLFVSDRQRVNDLINGIVMILVFDQKIQDPFLMTCHVCHDLSPIWESFSN